MMKQFAAGLLMIALFAEAQDEAATADAAEMTTMDTAAPIDDEMDGEEEDSEIQIAQDIVDAICEGVESIAEIAESVDDESGMGFLRRLQEEAAAEASEAGDLMDDMEADSDDMDGQSMWLCDQARLVLEELTRHDRASAEEKIEIQEEWAGEISQGLGDAISALFEGASTVAVVATTMAATASILAF